MNGIGKEARLRYLHGQFDILVPGDYVTCAITGQPIHLSQLRYWSVTLQEAYISPREALERLENFRPGDET